MTGKFDSWIIDTGASNHMTGCLQLCQTLQDIPNYPVGVPDGSNTAATKEGTVMIGNDLVLQNVLYVPGLTCNLISVSQLMDNSNCFVQFTNNLCVI